MTRWCTAAALLGLLVLATAAAGTPGTTAAGDGADDAAKMATGAMAEAAPFAEYVTPADSLPRLRYFADGLVTLNDRCPVRKVKLNPRMGAAYVNGHPVGFC
jgi:hypothetical protein